ncbi:hypothetical protein E4U53_001235 [Claviceps sorghi]|nr:hypothetical protein E4U53_001235 [Claviceps sorghi]
MHKTVKHKKHGYASRKASVAFEPNRQTCHRDDTHAWPSRPVSDADAGTVAYGPRAQRTACAWRGAPGGRSVDAQMPNAKCQNY